MITTAMLSTWVLFCIQGLHLHHPSGSLELLSNWMVFFQSYEELFISDLFWWLLTRAKQSFVLSDASSDWRAASVLRLSDPTLN